VLAALLEIAWGLIVALVLLGAAGAIAYELATDKRERRRLPVAGAAPRSA
jgi:hypothetical protein